MIAVTKTNVDVLELVARLARVVSLNINVPAVQGNLPLQGRSVLALLMTLAPVEQ
jgi:hypothetical protein